MTKRFTQSFKIQAVQKALSRTDGSRLEAFALSIGVGYSTLQNWIRQSKNQTLGVTQADIHTMKNERRPQDWNPQERLDMIIRCANLDETHVAELCRQKGIYPHHVSQWKEDFTTGKSTSNSGTAFEKKADLQQLKRENKQLQKELNRKDKALAETAALLVLQKKVNAIWGCDEDSSP